MELGELKIWLEENLFRFELDGWIGLTLDIADKISDGWLDFGYRMVGWILDGVIRYLLNRGGEDAMVHLSVQTDEQ